MRSLLLVLCLVGLAVFPCLAQQSTAPKHTAPTTTKLTQTAIETKTVTGEVKSVTLADSVKGTKSEIVVVDKSGTASKEFTLLVKSTTTIYDAEWNTFTLDKIKQYDKVTITYSTTKEGVYEAASIRIKNN